MLADPSDLLQPVFVLVLEPQQLRLALEPHFLGLRPGRLQIPLKLLELEMQFLSALTRPGQLPLQLIHLPLQFQLHILEPADLALQLVLLSIG
jgi:hypothetical protein